MLAHAITCLSLRLWCVRAGRAIAVSLSRQLPSVCRRVRLADVVVSVPAASYTLEQAVNMTADIAAQPDEVFQQLKENFGIMGVVSAEVVTAAQEAKTNNALSIGVGVGLGIGGALLAALAVFVGVRRRRQLVHFQPTVVGPSAAAAPVADVTAPSIRGHAAGASKLSSARARFPEEKKTTAKPASCPSMAQAESTEESNGNAKPARPSLTWAPTPEEPGSSHVTRKEAQLG